MSLGQEVDEFILFVETRIGKGLHFLNHGLRTLSHFSFDSRGLRNPL